MPDTENHLPSATDLIDWINDEGLLDLDWDFPEDGDLYEAGLGKAEVADLVAAVENEFGIELTVAEFTRLKISTPVMLAGLIAEKGGGH